MVLRLSESPAEVKRAAYRVVSSFDPWRGSALQGTRAPQDDSRAAIDAETKLIPHFDVGKRDMVTTYRFMDGPKARLAESFRFQLTTDGFVPYIGAVERAGRADTPDFGQLVKVYGATVPGPARYAPPKIVDARSLRITPAMAAGVTERVWELADLLAA